MPSTKLFLLSTLLASTLALPTVFRRSVYLGYNAAGSVTSPQGQKSYEGNLAAGPSVPASSYQCYDGDVANYPSVQSWLSFDALWDVNRDNILSANGGNTYLQHYIHDAILQVAGETNVNARLILALVMQESFGKTSVPCTGQSPNLNCGLMQAPYGSTSFDPTNPADSILDMIRQGVSGTTSGGSSGTGGPGYAQYLDGSLSWVRNPYPGNPYAAARAYNTGSVIGADLDAAGAGAAGYANDVANRLVGWDGTGAGFGACSA